MDKNLSLVIENSRMEDSGNYTCVLKSKGFKTIKKRFEVTIPDTEYRTPDPRLYQYSEGWNTHHVRNSNGRGLFGYPMVNKMAAIFLCFPMVRTMGKQNFWLAETDYFLYSGNQMALPLKARASI